MSPPEAQAQFERRGAPGWLPRLVGLVGATMAAYANSFRAQFQFDDFPSIVENPAIRDLSLFKHLLSPSGPRGEYPWLVLRPRWLGDLSFALDYRLWGLDPWGFHLTNFVVHLATSVLVFRLGVLLLRAPRLSGTRLSRQAGAVAWWAAMVFALHPVQTQAVTYVVQRYASLATFFVVAAAVAWFESRVRWGRGRRGAVLGSAAAAVVFSSLGMLTKEMVVTAPVLIGLADALLFAGDWRKRVLSWMPLGATSGLALAGALLGPPMLERLSAAGADTGAMGMTHLDFLLTELRVVATYLRLLVWPAGQNLFWDYPIEHTLWAPGVLGALGLVLGLLALATALALHPGAPAELRVVSWGIGWFFGALVVEAGAVLIIDVINEHRLYYPLVGLSLAASVGASWVAGQLVGQWRIPRWFPTALAACLLFGFSVATARRNATWETGVLLWEDAAAKSPGHPAPLFMVGLSWERDQAWAQAAAAYRRALVVDPRFMPARFGLRSMCMRVGDQGCVLHSSATVMLLNGDPSRALELWNSGLQVNPRNPQLHYGAGLALERLGQPEAAGQAFRAACDLGSSAGCGALMAPERPPPAP